jgi:murein L,D-transpeptidase YcbB/YkuD
MNQPLNYEDAVRNLQRYLRTISFYDNRITRVPIDGIYDSDTRKAVSEFQSTRGLRSTGIVDRKTFDMIFKEFSQIIEANDRSNNTNLFPSNPQNYEASLGEESSFVAIIQLILRELSIIYDNIPELEISGVYNEETEAAVKEFQKLSGLSPTGKVNLQTWNRLVRDFSNYAR